MKNITVPFTRETAREFRAGDILTITGTIYSARDAAHKRLCEAIAKGDPLPFDIKDQTVYFTGPTPAREGEVIGSAGPTTSVRMDAYSPILIEHGLTGMIGKGLRNDAVVNAMKEYGAVYFVATGGAGALLSTHIKSSELVAYEDLGTEAIRKFYVEDFPVICVIDSFGNNLYEESKKKYRIE